MLKKIITFEDFDGVKTTEEHHFHLSKTELMEVAMGLPDDMEIDGTESNEELSHKLLEKIGKDGLFKFIKDLILKSYGKKIDNRRFEKTEELSKEFSQTLAFDALLMELMSDDNEAAKFVNGIIPKDTMDSINANRQLPGNGN